MATLTVPYSFVNGTSIVASEMNSNFGAVKTFVEALSSGANLDAGSVTTAKLATATVQLLAPTGSITAYAGPTAPSGWLLCNGAAVSRAAYSDLFAIVGTAYGSGDGSTTFNLPNLSGRIPVGRDAAQTEFDVLGETGGAKTHTLTSAEMPSHQHGDGDLSAVSNGNHSHTADGDLTAANGGDHGHTGTVDSGGFHDHSIDTRNTTSTTHTHQSGSRISVGATATNETDTTRSTNYGGTHTHTFTTGNAGTHGHDITGSTSTNGAHTHDVSGSTSLTGGGGAHNNLQPYIVVNYIIKI